MSLCKKPFHKGSLAFGCGQCMPCRFTRHRLWTHRILLESLKHNSSTFVNLTYEEEPPGGTLVPKDTQDFLKRLRHHVSPRKLRFFLCGEYGEDKGRPHYHAAIFGLCPTEEELVRMAWGRGHVMVGDITPASAAYIAGYVTKKMNGRDERSIKWLNGRYPEFARMSLRPGIGAPAADDVVDVLTSEHGHIILDRTGDVPMTLKHGRRNLPLGRYMRSKIRERYGFKETSTPKEVLSALSKKMYLLFEADLAIAEAEGKTIKQFYMMREATRRQMIQNFETKARLFNSKKGTL